MSDRDLEEIAKLLSERQFGAASSKTPKSAATTSEPSFAKVALIWVGFFALIPIVVYLLIFLEDLGVKDVVVTFLAGGISWAIIFWLVFSYFGGKDEYGGRLPLFSPNSSLLEKLLSSSLVIAFFLPVFLVAIKFIKWILG